MPACIKFAPFLQVLVFFATLVKLLLRLSIAFLHRESAYILAPVWHTGDGEIESCCDLRLHILPTSAYIATPCSGAVTLFGSKTIASKQEHSLIVRRERVAEASLIPVGILLQPLAVRHIAPALLLYFGLIATLSVVDSFGIDDGIGIEKLVRRTIFRRSAEQFAILHISAVTHIRLTGIHPPGIHAYGAKLFVELTPEYLSCILIVCVIESILISEPVIEAILDALLVNHSLVIEFVEVIHCEIIFRPA